MIDMVMFIQVKDKKVIIEEDLAVKIKLIYKNIE